MKTITHFEVYVVKFGAWALQARFSEGERGQAEALAQELEKENERAAMIIEEKEDPETGQISVSIARRSSRPALGAKPPESDTNVSGRIVMVALNAVGVGGLLTLLVAVGLSSAGDRGSLPSGMYGLLLLFTFAAGTLIAGLALFKTYVPVELILWRAKDVEAQQKVARLLIYGTDEPDVEPAAAPPAAASQPQGSRPPKPAAAPAAPPPEPSAPR